MYLCIVFAINLIVFFLLLDTTFAFSRTTMQQQQKQQQQRSSSSLLSSSLPAQPEPQHPFCDLPGDPSLMLTTNVDLGTEKMNIMKACSKSIAKHTGKPETYVAVSITDNASVMFGGSEAPTALGCLYSIGSITKESNGAITADITNLLESAYGITEDRIYINFFDMPRANVGWSRRTFAG